MMDKKEVDEAIAHQKEMIRVLRKRLQQLELQKAQKGINTPPEIITEISSLSDNIHSHEIELQRLQRGTSKNRTSFEQQEDGVKEKTNKLVELQILEGDDIFYRGIEYLKTESHGEVLIYAPTGVWTNNPVKAAWFRTIAGCLANKSKKYPPQEIDLSVTTTLDNFMGVYGIPPLPQSDDQDEINEFSEKLDLMENLLLTFNGIERAHIYYLEVDTRNLPGTGAIFIDNDVVSLGFAIRGLHKVDYGISINGQADIAEKTNSWFNRHVMNLALPNVIQDTKIGRTVKQGMDEIRKNYGLAPKNETR